MRFGVLVGTWTLHRIEVADGEHLATLDQPDVAGMLRYTDDRRIWVILQVPPDRADGLLSGAYTGTVTCDVDTHSLVYHVSDGTTSFGPGSVFSRHVALSEDNAALVLSAPFGDGGTVRTCWRRVA